SPTHHITRIPSLCSFFSSLFRRPPIPTLFPYTTLFRSLVLDRGAVTRTDAFYPAGIERRTVNVRANDFVRLRGGGRNPARHLFHMELSVPHVIEGEGLAPASCLFIIIKCKSWRWFIPWLDLAAREIDRTRVKSAWRTCLKSSHCKTELAKAFAQTRMSIRHSP